MGNWVLSHVGESLGILMRKGCLLHEGNRLESLRGNGFWYMKENYGHLMGRRVLIQEGERLEILMGKRCLLHRERLDSLSRNLY